MKTVGVVVPTLFQRKEYLSLVLKSAREAGNAFVIIMGPEAETKRTEYGALCDELLNEPSEGNLAAKLSYALRSFPREVDLITWIGDDDLLCPGSLDVLVQKFQEDEALVLAFGGCTYLDADGNTIGQNKSGAWAIKVARYGPFLAPQPGSLFRRDAFEAIGGLNEELDLAFDFDLFLALSSQGKVGYVNKTLASFRWHKGSLSVRHRKTSVREASMVRLRHANGPNKTIVRIINPLVELATLLAGTFLSLSLDLRVNRHKKTLAKKRESA